MLGKEKNTGQLDLFRASLQQIIDLEHPLVALSLTIPWEKIEKDFEQFYPTQGAPSHPLRLMVGLLLLQRIYNLSDERITAWWKENPYCQFFCGKTHFQWRQPCAASDLVHFRKRIGEKGASLLFSLSVRLNTKKVQRAREVIVDTTVQPKNITYPTDEKLYKKIIDRCNRIAQRVGVKLRQSYQFVVKRLNYTKRYAPKKLCSKLARSVVSKLRTLAGRQVPDLSRKLLSRGREVLMQFSSQLSLISRLLAQKGQDRQKLYSLHAPEVSCIAKGKVHPKYEFGSKVSLAVLPRSHVVVGIKSYQGNPHDSKTLSESLWEAESNTGRSFTRLVVDKGYRGHNVKGKAVVMPERSRASSLSTKRSYKASLRRRCGIEAIISHLKKDHGLGLNYLQGIAGDGLNALLSATGYNLKLLLASC